jgi:hypothetical protein
VLLTPPPLAASHLLSPSSSNFAHTALLQGRGTGPAVSACARRHGRLDGARENGVGIKVCAGGA